MAIEFNTEFYLQSKFNQLQAEGRLEEFGLTDVASLEQYFADNNVDAEAHYLNAGMAEGINPSAEFDTNAYLEAKLAQLQGEEFEGQYADLTIEGLIEIFQDKGLTALAHYNQYGIGEGIEAQVPAEAVEGEDFDLTTGTDTLVASDAELEEGEEAVRTTELNDTINAVASALSAERTLNADDSIDGGAGEDTLNVTVNSSFTGFTGEGGVQNVENIVLTNEGTIARNFNATGIEGAEQYTLNGGVNLAGLEAAGVTVAVADRTADLTVAFTDEAVKGDEDALTLALENVGTVATDDAAADAMGVTAAEVEALTVNAEGVNVVNLANAAQAESLTVTGAGDLTIEGVGAALKTVDASAAEGAVDVNLANATGVTSVLAGAGDDTIRAVAGSDLTANATVNGGEGNDRLVLTTGGAATAQYAMAGIETIALGALGGALTFSARDVEGLQTIEATDALNDTATFARLGGTDLAFDLMGDDTAVEGAIQADHSGVSTVNVAGEEEDDTSATDLTLTNSNNVVLNVAADSIYNGELTANSASAIEADIQGALGSATVITANSATSANFTTGDVASTVKLVAAELTDLNVTAGDDFTLAADSVVSGVEALTVETAGAFDAGTNNINFDAVNQVNLSGNGSVLLNNLGANDLEYGITVNAEGLADGGLEVGTIDVGAGQAVNVDASDVLSTVSLGAVTVADEGSINVNLDGTSGAVDLGKLTASDVTVNAEGALSTVGGDDAASTAAAIEADTATITGSGLGVNNFDVTAAESATVTGGIAGDTFVIKATGTAAADEVVEFTLTGDLNGDTFSFGAITNAALRATITDFDADEDTIEGSLFGTTVTAAATTTEADDQEDIALFLQDALGLSEAIDSDLITNIAVITEDGTATDFSYQFEFNGATHIVTGVEATNASFDDGDSFITLSGVSDLSVNDIFAAAP